MIAYYKEYQKYNDFIVGTHTKSTDLISMAQRAYETYRDTNSSEDYAIILVDDYYCITKILGERGLILSRKDLFISDLVQPFDEERVYPMQRIKKQFSWAH